MKTFELVSLDILKAKLYRLMNERKDREYKISSDIYSYGDKATEAVVPLLKENKESDDEIREKYGEVRFV